MSRFDEFVKQSWKSLSHSPYLYRYMTVAAVVVLLLFVVDAVANWKIVKKTGNLGLVSVLFYVPCLNVLLLLALAFGEWPKRDT